MSTVTPHRSSARGASESLVQKLMRGIRSRGRAERSPRVAANATVNIHVRTLAQLFNSFDPSPFWDRDLDGRAAEFIENEFKDQRWTDLWHLHVEVLDAAGSAHDLQIAVKSHYGRQANSARLLLRESMRIGRFAFMGGAIIFSLCMTGFGILRRGSDQLWPSMAREGLLIVGWLALWRPVESLLYGWIPFYRQQRFYERLAQLRVTVHVSASADRTTNLRY